MNALQQEYLTLRDAGMRPLDALAAMRTWRDGAGAVIRRGPGLLPRPVADLLVDLAAERERVTCVRRLISDVVGARP